MPEGSVARAECGRGHLGDHPTALQQVKGAGREIILPGEYIGVVAALRHRHARFGGRDRLSGRLLRVPGIQLSVGNAHGEGDGPGGDVVEQAVVEFRVLFKDRFDELELGLLGRHHKRVSRAELLPAGGHV